MEIAKKLEKEIPKSVWAQVSLFKNYLEKNDGAKCGKINEYSFGKSEN